MNPEWGQCVDCKKRIKRDKSDPWHDQSLCYPCWDRKGRPGRFKKPRLKVDVEKAIPPLTESNLEEFLAGQRGIIKREMEKVKVQMKVKNWVERILGF